MNDIYNKTLIRNAILMETTGPFFSEGKDIRGMNFLCRRELEHFAELLNGNHRLSCNSDRDNVLKFRSCM